MVNRREPDVLDRRHVFKTAVELEDSPGRPAQHGVPRRTH
jgi:hypothetical protein